MRKGVARVGVSRVIILMLRPPSLTDQVDVRDGGVGY